ncbi:MAG: family 10 glycosylhydrolase [bacterium]|nr:family 10 glycosylhydrolase [bacterium]
MKTKILVLFVFLLVAYLFFIPVKDYERKASKKEEKRAVFISYMELQKYLKGKDEKTAKANINKMISALKSNKFNMIILQVRSFSDAIYESQYFPWSMVISENEGEAYHFDVLAYFIEMSHKNNLELHAWINPYRIRTNNDVSTITVKNPAYNLLETNDVDISDNGIYYNPASSNVQKLILDGIEEILENYQVDGIHFDDYFYPNLDIDNENYLEYSKHNDISKDKYHLLMVNNLVKETHKLTKKHHVVFGISPEGNIENNYSKNQADVYTWAKSNEYVDYLMPQIYYGFQNEAAPFYNVLKKWDNLVKESDVKILPALAFYKSNQEDLYAKNGKYEWIENDDIIMRQVLLSRNMQSYAGFALFRYDSIFKEEVTEVVNSEIKNLKKIMD